MNSPLYIKNIGDRNINCLAAASAFLNDRIISSYAQYGYGLYAVVHKQSGQLLGMSGLVRRDGLSSADIGFAFLPEYQGKGYAYEASEQVMQFALKVLKLDPILAITTRENKRSISLLNKLGLLYRREIEWQGEKILLFSTGPE